MYRLILFSLLLLTSCCIFNRTRTKTINDTIIKVDTIIRIKYDTVTLIREVHLTDTAYIENKVARAISYYSPEKNKIVLQLTGKTFTVPIHIYKHTIIKNDVTKRQQVKNNFKWYFGVFCFLIVLVITAYIIHIFKK